MTDRRFEDFSVGDVVSFSRRFESGDFDAFSALSGDDNPLHHDGAYATAAGFDQPIVPLFLASAPVSAIAGTMLPGHRSLIIDSHLRALAPVPYDTDIVYSGMVVARSEASRVLRLRVLAIDGERVLIHAELTVQVRDGDQLAGWSGDVDIERTSSPGVALVLGGSGTIGTAVRRGLVDHGWTVVSHARREATNDGITGDLATSAGRRAILDALSRQGPVTAIVHAAGAPVDAAADEQLAVSYVSLRAVVEAALPSMLRRQHGRIVVVGSSALQTAPIGWDDYVASRASAAAYTASVHRRYAPFGITATVVAPGYVLTPYSDAFRPPSAACLLPEEVAEAVVAQLGGGASGGYVWIEPDSTRTGDFGFVDRNRRDALSASAVSTSAGPPAPTRPSDVDGIVRRFFRISAAEPLDDAGLGITPGWDSLAQIELLLAVETELGLSFATSELDETSTVAALRRLVARKLDDRGGR